MSRQVAGDPRHLVAKKHLSNLRSLEAPLKNAYENVITGAQKNGALNVLTNWNMGAANPTVARENALYVAVCLLTMVVMFLVGRELKEEMKALDNS